MCNIMLTFNVVFFATCFVVKAIDVLFIPFPQKAYIVNSLKVIEELHHRGHRVDVLMPQSMIDTKNVPKGVRVLQYTFTSETEDNIAEYLQGLLNKKEKLDRISNVLKLFSHVKERLENICAGLYSERLFEELKKRHYDLAYVTVFPFRPCQLLVPYNMSIPTIVEIPLLLPMSLGIPSLPSFVPGMSLPLINNMTFKDRIKNIIGITMLHVSSFYIGIGTESIQKYAPHFHSWTDLLNNGSFYIVLRDSFTEWHYPKMPHVLQTSGLNFGPATPLPSHIQKIMDKSEEPVVLMSFGSIFNNLSSDIIDRYLAAIPSEYTLIFSYKGNTKHLKNLRDNVHILPWVPQNDILGHIKTQLFISHGGQRSLIESIYHAVPIVTIPLQPEQHHTSLFLKIKGYGVTLDYYSFTSAELTSAIYEVLQNPYYRNNIKKTSDILKSSPHPKIVISNWIERIHKHGHHHFKTPLLNMPVWKYLMLDIIAVFIACICVTLFILKHLVRKIIQRAIIKEHNS